MVVSAEKLHQAIMIYAEEEIASKATGLTRFASYFLISSLHNHPEKTVGLLLNNPFIKMTDIVREDGMIKADELYSAARAAMEKAVSVTIAGITFSVPDVDRIYTILQRG
jgi:hypothetical protein